MKVYVNDDRTVLVRVWERPSGRKDIVEVATREHSDAIWGPPVRVKLEAP